MVEKRGAKNKISIIIIQEKRQRTKIVHLQGKAHQEPKVNTHQLQGLRQRFDIEQ